MSKLDPHTNPAFRPPLTLPGGLPLRCVSPHPQAAHGDTSHIVGSLHKTAQPIGTVAITAATLTGLLRATLLCLIISSMASHLFSDGVEKHDTNASSSYHDVRGRLISRRGYSVYDAFQQTHGPGYSREEMDDALRIPSVRNSIHEDIRRQHDLHQQAQGTEKSDRPTAPSQPDQTSTTSSTTTQEENCFYHRAFGGKAKKCRPPCPFSWSGQ